MAAAETRMPTATKALAEREASMDGQPFKRKVGDVWTCAVGDADVDVNNGSEPAVMRIFMLMKA